MEQILKQIIQGGDESFEDYKSKDTKPFKVAKTLEQISDMLRSQLNVDSVDQMNLGTSHLIDRNEVQFESFQVERLEPLENNIEPEEDILQI